MNLKKIYRNPLSLNFKFTNTDALKNKHSHGNFYFGRFNSPFGDMLLICKETGLCGLGFTSQFGETYVLKSRKNYAYFHHLAFLTTIFLSTFEHLQVTGCLQYAILCRKQLVMHWFCKTI